MSTFLVYTSPARGHLYPMMDVALALAASGHRVVVQTLADARDEVLAQGLEHRPIDPRIEALPLDDYEGGNPLQQMGRALACWLQRAPFELSDVETSVREVAPDVLVIDANSWGAAAAAEAGGRPWSLFLPYCLPVPSRDAPAFGPGLPPPRGLLGRLRDRLLWFVQGLASRSALRGLNGLRAEQGLPALRGSSELFTRAPLLLYRTAEPFEYPRSDWRANVRALGPGLWAPAGEAPDWLDALPHPRVLVSVSTELQEDGAIIETALQALAGEPGSVIVTTAALDPAGFVAPNERTRIVRFLPHAAVLPKVDLVVTHGGMGTTQRALAAGVPLCVVPWGRDQLESARRVQECGAGTFVPRARLTPAHLKQAIHEALGRRDQARAVSAAFAKAAGARGAVALLEELLQGWAVSAADARHSAESSSLGTHGARRAEVAG